MATIRFIREDLEVQCNPGENLRELVMKEKLQLYANFERLSFFITF